MVALKGRRIRNARLIPHVAFVKSNVISFQNRSVFILECQPFVMLVLIRHIFDLMLPVTGMDLPPFQGYRGGADHQPRQKPGLGSLTALR